MKKGTVTDPERLEQLTAFFFWTSWACVTERPGQSITYTNNWPPEQLVGNVPMPALHLWTGFSVILLIAGIGLLAWWYASHKEDDLDHSELPDRDPLLGLKPTASMQATLKYFWVVSALFLVQMVMGISIGALRGRGRRFLRHSDRPVAAVRRSPEPGIRSWAFSGSRLPGSRPVCISGPPSRERAQIPALRRQHSLRRTDCSRRRIDDRRVARRDGQDDRRQLVLLRPPGLRVCRPGSYLADCLWSDSSFGSGWLVRCIHAAIRKGGDKSH